MNINLKSCASLTTNEFGGLPSLNENPLTDSSSRSFERRQRKPQHQRLVPARLGLKQRVNAPSAIKPDWNRSALKHLE